MGRSALKHCFRKYHTILLHKPFVMSFKVTFSFSSPSKKTLILPAHIVWHTRGSLCGGLGGFWI